MLTWVPCEGFLLSAAAHEECAVGAQTGQRQGQSWLMQARCGGVMRVWLGQDAAHSPGVALQVRDRMFPLLLGPASSLATAASSARLLHMQWQMQSEVPMQ